MQPCGATLGLSSSLPATLPLTTSRASPWEMMPLPSWLGRLRAPATSDAVKAAAACLSSCIQTMRSMLNRHTVDYLRSWLCCLASGVDELD